MLPNSFPAGRVAQSAGHLTRKSGVLGSIPGLATYFRFSFRFFKKGSCQYVHEVLVNRLEGLSLPRKNVVRLTDRPDMTLDVYRGRKTTIQQQQQPGRHMMPHYVVFATKGQLTSFAGWVCFCSLLYITQPAVCYRRAECFLNSSKHYPKCFLWIDFI